MSKPWVLFAALSSALAVGAGTALAYDRRGRSRGLGMVDIVNGRRHTGTEAELVRSGARRVACKSGLVNQARCWEKKGGLRGPDDDEDDAPDFGEDSWFDRLRAKLDAKRNKIRSAFAISPAIIVTQTDGRETLVIRSGEMQNPHEGSERVTFFWKDGPVGHVTKHKPEELIEEVSGYGLEARPATDAEVIAWTSTPEFEEGAARVAAVQRANAGLKGAKRRKRVLVGAPRELKPGRPNLNLDEHADSDTVETFEVPWRYERKPQAPARFHAAGKPGAVPIEQLIATQRAVTVRGVDKYATDNGKDLPIVYRATDGRLWIADGHHRAAAAWRRGDAKLHAKIVDIPDEYTR